MIDEHLEEAIDGLSGVISKTKGLMGTTAGQCDLNRRPGSILCPAIKIYSNLLKKSGLSSIKDVDDALKSNYQFERIAERFWSIEEEWDQLLSSIDEAFEVQTRKSYSIIREGQDIPFEISLENINGRTSTLAEIVQEHSQDLPMIHLVLLRHLS